MSVYVYEAGADVHALRIDDFRGPEVDALRDTPDVLYPIPGNNHVRAGPWVPGAIQYPAMSDQNIRHGAPFRRVHLRVQIQVLQGM